jgi:hypothetical protein
VESYNLSAAPPISPTLIRQGRGRGIGKGENREGSEKEGEKRTKKGVG